MLHPSVPEEYEVLGICPADRGWRATYWHLDEQGEFVYTEDPIVVWALVKFEEDDGCLMTIVVGMISEGSYGLQPAENHEMFVGYLAPDEVPETLRLDAEWQRELLAEIQSQAEE